MIKKTESIKTPPSYRQRLYYRTANAIRSGGVRYTMTKRNKQSKKNRGRVKTTVLR